MNNYQTCYEQSTSAKSPMEHESWDLLSDPRQDQYNLHLSPTELLDNLSQLDDKQPYGHDSQQMDDQIYQENPMLPGKNLMLNYNRSRISDILTNIVGIKILIELYCQMAIQESKQKQDGPKNSSFNQKKRKSKYQDLSKPHTQNQSEAYQSDPPKQKNITLDKENQLSDQPPNKKVHEPPEKGKKKKVQYLDHNRNQYFMRLYLKIVFYNWVYFQIVDLPKTKKLAKIKNKWINPQFLKILDSRKYTDENLYKLIHTYPLKNRNGGENSSFKNYWDDACEQKFILLINQKKNFKGREQIKKRYILFAKKLKNIKSEETYKDGMFRKQMKKQKKSEERNEMSVEQDSSQHLNESVNEKNLEDAELQQKKQMKAQQREEREELFSEQMSTEILPETLSKSDLSKNSKYIRNQEFGFKRNISLPIIGIDCNICENYNLFSYLYLLPLTIQQWIQEQVKNDFRE